MIDGVTYIFPHVPKCAGTSVKVMLQNSGLRVFFDYDHPPGSNPYHQKQSEKRNAEYSLLDFSPFDVVFGHFPIQRYVRDNYRYVTVVRDPYKRIVSHYHFMLSRLEAGVTLPPNVLKVAQQLQSGELSVADWAIRLGTCRIYKDYLSYKPPEEFTLVGDTSQMASFTTQLSELLNVKFESEVRERESKKNFPAIPEEDERRIRAELADELEYYEAMRPK